MSHKLKPKMPEFYVCDGKKKCQHATGCKNQGGSCYHTKDIKHALYNTHLDMQRKSDGSMWEVIRKEKTNDKAGSSESDSTDEEGRKAGDPQGASTCEAEGNPGGPAEEKVE